MGTTRSESSEVVGLSDTVSSMSKGYSWSTTSSFPSNWELQINELPFNTTLILSSFGLLSHWDQIHSWMQQECLWVSCWKKWLKTATDFSVLQPFPMKYFCNQNRPTFSTNIFDNLWRFPWKYIHHQNHQFSCKFSVLNPFPAGRFWHFSQFQPFSYL